MRGYGRDYDDGGRNWIERAGETVRGWFGAGHDYDRDYGWDGGSARGMHRDWDRGRMGGRGDWGRGETDWRGVGGGGGGYRMNNWNNQHATRDTVERAAGGYYGMDYEDRGGYSGGSMRGSTWGGNDYGRDYGASGWGRGGTYRGPQCGMGRGGMSRGTSGGGMRDRWMAEAEREDAGYGNWGDYNRGAYGGEAFRNNRSGGVEPGRYFSGYGHGSSGGNGYEPY